MANTITNLNDVRISEKVLAPWMAMLAPLSAFSTDFSSSPAEKGDTVKVAIIGDPSASNDFDGDYTKNSGGSASAITVTLNKHKYKTVELSAKQAAMISTAPQILEKMATAAAEKLAEDVVTDILSLVKKANYGNPALADVDTDGFNYKNVIALREQCAKAKMPSSNRSLILDSSLYSALLADEVVAKSFVPNLAATSVIDGQVNRLSGFSVIETTAMPDNGERLVGFAVNPSAIAIAMRYIEPVASYAEAGAVTDPVSGVTLGYRRWTKKDSDKVYITFDVLYGYAVGKKSALLYITKAAETP